MEIIEELLQNKPLVFGIIGALVAAIILVGYLIYREKKKDQEEIDDIMSSLVEPKRKPITEIEEDEEVVVQEEKNVLVQEISEEQKEEKQDLETQEKTLDIEAMLEKMQQDLNTKAEDVVATFEQEQEENSIISYQELVRSLKGEKIEKTPVRIEDVVSEEPVKLEQLSMDIEDVEEKEEYSKKFQKTDFISPVYGKMNERLEYPTVPQFNKNDKEIEKELETYESKVESNLVNKNIDDFIGDFEFDNNIEVNSLEQTLNMKPLSEEIKKNDDFLKALKDFRKNLD